jgi:hypothetical protein
MRKLKWGFGCALLTMFLPTLHAAYAQIAAGQVPKDFQIYYEVVAPPVSSLADTFDSEKKTRTVEAVKGMVTYSAVLSEDEKSSLYAAIVQNDLLTIKDTFPKSPSWNITPATAGKLRFTIEGKTKEISFNLGAGCLASGGKADDDDDLFTYLAQLAQSRMGAPCVPDPEWTRFNSVRRLIDSILKAKDDQQHIARPAAF